MNTDTSQTHIHVYASAIDTWLLIVLGLCMAGMISLVAWIAVTDTRPMPIAMTAAMTTALGGLFADMLLNTNYTISNGGRLIIKCGFAQLHIIDISKITSIKSTQSWLSAPALSVRHRIKVKYGRGQNIIISPRNRHDFIDNLLQINPHIDIHP